MEKGVTLRLNKFELPSPKDALCQDWLKLAHSFLKRRWKYEKLTDGQTDGWTYGQTDDGRQVIREAYLSFQPRYPEEVEKAYKMGVRKTLTEYMQKLF